VDGASFADAVYAAHWGYLDRQADTLFERASADWLPT
jgi:hypothetical protein